MFQFYPPGCWQDGKRWLWVASPLHVASQPLTRGLYTPGKKPGCTLPTELCWMEGTVQSRGRLFGSAFFTAVTASRSGLRGERFIWAHRGQGKAGPAGQGRRGVGRHCICDGKSLQPLLVHILVNQEPRPISSDVLLLAKPQPKQYHS